MCREGWDKHQTVQSMLSNIRQVLTYRAGGGCCAPRNTVRNSSEQLCYQQSRAVKQRALGVYMCAGGKFAGT